MTGTLCNIAARLHRQIDLQIVCVAVKRELIIEPSGNMQLFEKRIGPRVRGALQEDTSPITTEKAVRDK